MVSSSSKVIPSADAPKIREPVCAESSDLSIAFLPGRDYNQTIDSNGAVGHLLTRSAVFVRKAFVLWGAALRQTKRRRKGKKIRSSKE